MTKQEIIVDFSDPTLYVDWVTEITEALYDPNIRYIFLKWWAGAGKSYAVVQLLVQNIMDSVRIGVFRKTATSLRASCLQLFKDVSSSRDLTNNYLDIKESKEIQNVNGDWLAMMFWLDDEEKIKSLANFDWFWVEETTEITMDDFTQLDLRLRGWNNHKIICTFNPISSRHWLKTQVEDKKRHDAKRIYKTAWDNKFIDERYLKNLEAMKDKNEAKYKIYALNQRGEAVEWLVYQQYTTFTHDIVPEVIGLDFWWNDPTAMVYLRREDVQWGKKKLYVQEKIYASELSSSDIITLLQKYNVPKNILIIADSARPEMISDIKKWWYHIIGVDKYSWSVKDQIANVQEYDLHVNWHNIEREVATYMRKRDKNGQAMDVPEDGDDHLCDSTRYWCTYFKKAKARATFI